MWPMGCKRPWSVLDATAKSVLLYFILPQQTEQLSISGRSPTRGTPQHSTSCNHLVLLYFNGGNGTKATRPLSVTLPLMYQAE